MTQILPTRRSLQFAEALIHYHRYQPAVLLEHDSTTYPLNANWSDTVHVFEYRQQLYVLTVNLSLPTIRLDIFAGKQREALASLALTEKAQIKAILGMKWQKLTTKSMAVLLANQMVRKGGDA